MGGMLEGPEQDWVSGAPEHEAMILIYFRQVHVVLLAELDLGNEQIHDCDGLERPQDLGLVQMDEVRQLPGDAADLLLFFLQEVDERVVQFDGLGGLDEERLTAVAAAMHDSLDAAALIGPKRQDHSVVVEGRVGILQIRRDRRLPEHAIEYLARSLLDVVDLAAEAGE